MTRQHVIALIVACALFMQNLDSTILGTALPAIAESLSVGPVQLHLAMTAYLLSLAVFMPLSGWMADRWGARRIFIAAILTFTGASIACGLSPSADVLIAARVVQGMGGAMMVPVARLVLVRAVPKAELVNAMAWVTVPALVGPVLGPPVGGILTTYASWHWIFWINIPFGVIAIAMAIAFIKDVREDEVPPLDVLGFVLCGAGVAGLVLGIESIGDALIPPAIAGVLAVLGAATLTLYVMRALRVTAPVIDVRLLAIPTFRASVVGGSLFRIGVGALPFLLPLLLQAGFGWSAVESGLVTFYAAAGALLMKIGVERVLRSFGFRAVLMWNAVLSGVGMAACALFQPATPYWVMASILLVGGFFRSLQFTAVNAVAFAEVPHDRLSNATSFTSMAQQLSLSVGIGFGAVALELAGLTHGGPLRPSDFVPAFIAVGLAATASGLVFARLHPNAGAEMAHRPVHTAGAMGGTSSPPPHRDENAPR